MNDNIKPANATLDQAAAYLQMCRRTVLSYQDRGILKPVYFGRRRFFRWSDLERLAKTGTAVRQPDPNQIKEPRPDARRG